MSLIRVCDRCRVEVLEAPPLAERTVIVGRGAPSTNPVARDIEVALGVQLASGDLCAPCLASALVELASARNVLEAVRAAVKKQPTAKPAALVDIGNPDPTVAEVVPIEAEEPGK